MYYLLRSYFATFSEELPSHNALDITPTYKIVAWILPISLCPQDKGHPSSEENPNLVSRFCFSMSEPYTALSSDEE